MNPKIKRQSIYFILIPAFGIAGYNYFMEYKPLKGMKRSSDYFEGSKKKLTDSEKTDVQQFCHKLCKLYDVIKKDTTYLRNSSVIKKIPVSKEFKPNICTYELLDFMCDGEFVSSRLSISKSEYYKQNISSYGPQQFLQQINRYFGNGDFDYKLANKQWNGGVLNEIKKIAEDRYLLVIVAEELIVPEFMESTQTYNRSVFKGKLYAVNINTAEILAIQNLYIENDKSMSSIALKKYAMDEKLMENLGENIFKAVNESSLLIFGTALDEYTQ